jgi:cytosine/uracil/thiamine/allantoin permease
MLKQRGLAVLTLVGSMITAWSYFGTNQLGVGLHAYGFNDKLANGLVVFWLLHLGLIGVGMLPLKWWRSFATPAAGPARAAIAPYKTGSILLKP